MFYAIRISTYLVRFILVAWIISTSVMMGISRDTAICLGLICFMISMILDSDIPILLGDFVVFPAFIYFIFRFLFKVLGISSNFLQ